MGRPKQVNNHEAERLERERTARQQEQSNIAAGQAAFTQKETVKRDRMLDEISQQREDDLRQADTDVELSTPDASTTSKKRNRFNLGGTRAKSTSQLRL